MKSIKADVNRQVEADVVVLGYGCAGSIAAITAHDKGAGVLILEKMPQGGGATFLSNGGIWAPSSMDFAKYLHDICAGTTEMDLLEKFVEEAMKIEDYIREELGGVFERWVSQEIAASFPPLTRPSWPKVPHGKNMIRGHIKAYDPDELKEDASFAEKVRAIGRAYGPDLWRLVSENVKKRGIEVMLETPARELVQNESGEVTGVIAETRGEKIMVKAHRAVVMATGGFGANETLLKAYYPCPFYYNGLSYAQGDGLIMAQKAGAQMWHMLGICGQLGFKAPEYEAAFQIRNPSKNFIVVDKAGKRFEDETNTKVHNAWRTASIYDPEELQYPRIPCYIIFDESTREKAPMSRDWRPHNDYFWSLDNSAEIEKGWIKKGDTIDQLAGRISMDGAFLEQTVTRFNEFCRIGKDPEFGRAEEFMGPIDKPPFYALPLWPTIISTSGGPRHDRESRLLDNDNRPIPRLYAAGELGSFIGMLYEAGSGFAECLVFGKIAGENAAKEAPLSRD
ncbi:MAG: FAD-dependent oxidoreductase [Deltaproteobacteria bacterium]|nr:FAD-dependent oxidoreductase [Deltaproteobacteria bacterium]